MSIEWTDGNEEFEANVVDCILKSGKQINILFKGVYNSDDFEGRLSIKIKEGKQKRTGTFNFPDSKDKSKEIETPAQIEGELIEFKGKDVYFEGSWTDEEESLNFTVDTSITRRT